MARYHAPAGPELLRSLSHPLRLLVLRALGDEERSVDELRDLLDIDQVPMSQQLMRLSAGGLVDARRKGRRSTNGSRGRRCSRVIGAPHSAFCLN
ncbi:Regulatory protein ArsR (fragment) [Mesorhizobium plurifarium]|uniref:Regulatory protein ArsR n=1 Tax=Mesorhizobium plurifarium TaxID=69974 RepID=A0A090DF60_MESPL